MEAQIENIELALERGISDISEYIAEFKYSFKRAKTILKQFRNLTSAYKVSLNPVDISYLEKNFKELCFSRRVEVECHNYATGKYLFDYDKIFECLEELLGNSIYCNSSPVKVEIIFRDDENKLEIIYSDDGIGIEDENKKKIFDFGFSNREGGSGMGMNSVKQVVMSHRGNIIESGIPGDGVVFHISLPVAINQ